MISPTKGRIVILRDSTPEHTGIIKLPDPPKPKSSGTVVNTFVPTSHLNVGDHVHFGSFGMSEVVDPDDGETYLVMDEENIIAVLVKTEEV